MDGGGGAVCQWISSISIKKGFINSLANIHPLKSEKLLVSQQKLYLAKIGDAFHPNIREQQYIVNPIRR